MPVAKEFGYVVALENLQLYRERYLYTRCSRAATSGTLCPKPNPGRVWLRTRYVRPFRRGKAVRADGEAARADMPT